MADDEVRVGLKEETPSRMRGGGWGGDLEEI